MKTTFRNLHWLVYLLFELIIINIYYVYYSPDVAKVIEVSSKHIFMRADWLILFFVLAIVLEVASFYYIPFRKKKTKTIYSYFAWLPRLLLFFELIRHVFYSVGPENPSDNTLLSWFFLVLLIVVIKEGVMYYIMLEKHYKKDELPYNYRMFLSRLLFLPLFLLWSTMYKHQTVFLADKTELFPFLGLFFVFVYFPLHFQWIVLNFENRKLTVFNVIYFLVEPVIIYVIE